MGASSSRRLGCSKKISLDFKQSCLISDSESCTCLPGLPLTSSKRLIIPSSAKEFIFLPYYNYKLIFFTKPCTHHTHTQKKRGTRNQIQTWITVKLTRRIIHQDWSFWIWSKKERKVEGNKVSGLWWSSNLIISNSKNTKQKEITKKDGIFFWIKEEHKHIWMDGWIADFAFGKWPNETRVWWMNYGLFSLFWRSIHSCLSYV